MATISKRGSRWTAQVRRKGYPSTSRTFGTKADAKAWAVSEEARIEQNEAPTPRRQLESLTLAAIIDRYLDEVTPTKLSATTERQRLRKLQTDPLAKITLTDLTSTDIAGYRDRRLRTVRPGTIRRELGLIQHAWDIAHKEWGYRLGPNPVKDIRQPKLNNARDRRLDAGEYEKLIAAVRRCRNPVLLPVVEFALHTGMRRGEIVNMRWEHVDMEVRITHIPHTKTGRPRSIPLSDGALAILKARSPGKGSVFGITANGLKLAWQRAVGRSGLHDFHFHDLRHEAISRFFELGLSLPEVAIISGHRDPRMLFRYTHLRPLELAQKLAGRSWAAERGQANPHQP